MTKRGAITIFFIMISMMIFCQAPSGYKKAIDIGISAGNVNRTGSYEYCVGRGKKCFVSGVILSVDTSFVILNSSEAEFSPKAYPIKVFFKKLPPFSEGEHVSIWGVSDGYEQGNINYRNQKQYVTFAKLIGEYYSGEIVGRNFEMPTKQIAKDARIKIVINNQDFIEDLQSTENLDRYEIAMWDHQGAIFAEYDNSTLLFLTGIVNQVDRNGDEFAYYIMADHGITPGQSMIVALGKERVKQVQVDARIALKGSYIETKNIDYSNIVTGYKTKEKTPVIRILSMGIYYPGLGVDWTYNSSDSD